MIKRTALSYRRKASVWIEEPDTGEGAYFANEVYDKDLPTHSPVLGPDGFPLEYEPRQPMGFDLRKRE